MMNMTTWLRMDDGQKSKRPDNTGHESVCNLNDAHSHNPTFQDPVHVQSTSLMDCKCLASVDSACIEAPIWIWYCWAKWAAFAGKQLQSQLGIVTEGVIWGPKWVWFSHAPRAGGHNWYVSSSGLICGSQCSWAWNIPVMATCLSSRGMNLTFWAAICCSWPASAPNPLVFSV